MNTATRPPAARPALDKGVQFLEEGIRREIWRAGTPLPPVRELARQAGVSRLSMLRALAVCKKQGLVHGTTRSRYRVSGAPATPREESSLAGPKWKAAMSRLRDDLVQGAFPPAERLPAYGELQNRYGVGFLALKKALLELSRSRWLKQAGKSFTVPELKLGRGEGSPVIIGPGNRHNKMDRRNPKNNTFLGEVERRLLPLGYTPPIIPFHPTQRAANIKMLQTMDRDAIGGIVFLCGEAWMQEQTVWLARQLADFGHRISIFDSNGDFPTDALDGSPAGKSRVITVAARSAGESAASMLLRNGHHHVAYISAQHKHPWSQRRWQGLRERYARAGIDKAVRLFVREEIVHKYDLAYALSDLDERTLKRIIGAHANDTRVNQSYDHYASIRTLPSVATLKESRFDDLRHPFYSLEEMLREGVDELLVARARKLTVDYVGDLAMAEYLAPLFEQALADKAITAWVCANDATAIAAQHFLQSRGLRVPEDISLLGYDNLVEASENRITSFDFNLPMAAYHALAFVMRSGLPQPKVTGPWEQTGFWVERSSLLAL